jgi:Ras homolog gene family, member A
LRNDPKTIEELNKTSQSPVSESQVSWYPHSVTDLGWPADSCIQGEEVRKKIGAYKYLECSARTSDGVKEVFEAATRAALLKITKGGRGGKTKSKCLML